MKSFFKELENELYDTINNSPLSIEAKYYIIENLYQKVSNAYNEFLNMPEPEIKEETIEDTTVALPEEPVVERIDNEDGTFSIKSTGRNLQDTIDKAINNAMGKNKKEKIISNRD